MFILRWRANSCFSHKSQYSFSVMEAGACLLWQVANKPLTIFDGGRFFVVCC